MIDFQTRQKSDPDILARQLIFSGLQARNMNKSWDGKGHSIDYLSMDGLRLGKMLPGRGLYLDMDLKELGITKQLPHVFQRSLSHRLLEIVKKGRERARFQQFLTDEVGAIATYDGIIAGRASGLWSDPMINKATLTTTANNWYDCFRMTGQPAAGVYNSTTAPTGTVTTNATLGAWSATIPNPTSSRKRYLLTLGYYSANQINFAWLVDLLVQSGSFRLTVNTEETVASPPALTRYTSGTGVQIAFVCTTGSSATGHTLTVKYTDDAGNTGQTTPMTAPATAMIASQIAYPALSPFVLLASGDYGAQALKSTTSSAALGAGVIAGLLVYPLAAMPGVSGGMYMERESTTQIDGITEIAQSSGAVLGCLNMFILTNTTSTGNFGAFMRTVEG